MTDWIETGARARGLAGSLLGRATLETLARVDSQRAFGRALRATAYSAIPFPDVPRAADIDRTARRWAARQLSTLARWAGRRLAALAVVYDDEDRRSVSALCRGALEGAAPELRLAGLIATPALPERALEELARLRSPAAVAATLVMWKHPYGSVLTPAAEGIRPDPGLIEYALDGAFADRALRAARRSGELTDYVRETIDLENIGGALAIAGVAGAEPRFLAEGAHVDESSYLRAARTDSAMAALVSLQADLRRTPLGAPLREVRTVMELEAKMLAWRMRAWRTRAILAPQGPAPVLAYVLRLRAEVLDLRSTAWSLAFGAHADPSLLVTE